MSVSFYNVVMTAVFAVGILFIWLSFYPENLHFLSEKIAPTEDDDFSILPDVSTLQTKLMIPLARRIAKANRRKIIPRETLEEIETLLKSAGRPFNITAIEYYYLKYAYAIFFMVLAAYACVLLEVPIFLCVVGGVAGISAPKQWLQKIAKDRQEVADMELPNILDLLSVCMNSGMTLLAALGVICENNEGLLVDEFKKIRNDIGSGESITRAFYELTLRIQSKRINLVYQNVKLSEEYGTPIADKLAMMSDTVREDVFELTKQRAAKSAQYVLMPVIAFIFPALGIILGGPFIYRVMSGG